MSIGINSMKTGAPKKQFNVKTSDIHPDRSPRRSHHGAIPVCRVDTRTPEL